MRATDEPSFAPSNGSRKGKVIRPPRIVLAKDQSEALRDRLVAELSDLKSADEAADWVHKNLPAIVRDSGRRDCDCIFNLDWRSRSAGSIIATSMDGRCARSARLSRRGEWEPSPIRSFRAFS
jgi:hypothetical protein